MEESHFGFGLLHRIAIRSGIKSTPPGQGTRPTEPWGAPQSLKLSCANVDGYGLRSGPILEIGLDAPAQTFGDTVDGFQSFPKSGDGFAVILGWASARSMRRQTCFWKLGGKESVTFHSFSLFLSCFVDIHLLGSLGGGVSRHPS
jgi:hypothetical protein